MFFVEIRCPHCGKVVAPFARGVALNSASVPITRSPDGKAMLDWDSGDIDLDFEYICPECEGLVCGSLDELDEKGDDDNEK